MSQRLESRLAALIALFLIAGCAHQGSRSGASPQASGENLARGRQVFARECAACHGVSGTGGPVGPSLKNEGARRSFVFIKSVIADPDPPMPKLYPGRLTKNDVENVSAYVDSL